MMHMFHGLCAVSSMWVARQYACSSSAGSSDNSKNNSSSASSLDQQGKLHVDSEITVQAQQAEQLYGTAGPGAAGGEAGPHSACDHSNGAKAAVRPLTFVRLAYLLPCSGAPDFTIVLDSAGMTHKTLPGAESAKDVAAVAQCRSGASSSSIVLQPDAAVLDTAAAPKKAQRPRTFYVDWLRAFLTVLVVCHHCITAYQSSYAWAGKRGDTALWLLSQLFVGANQAYFMTLFFFLSGLYVPGSYRRKGPLSFMWDRTLRLVLPCIVYSFLAPPFILMWNEMAKNPKGSALTAWGNAYRGWLKPGWPTTYVLPTGPVSASACCWPSAPVCPQDSCACMFLTGQLLEIMLGSCA